jgi:pimeloyl-ACP methyl ester carboxylesterase
MDDIVGPEIRELQADTAKYALKLSAGMFGATALLRPFLMDSVAEEAHMPDALIGRYLAPFLGREGASHLLVLAGALTSEDAADIELRRIAQRTLILRGTRDRWCTRGIAEDYESALPRGHYEHIDGVGHLVPEESASDLARLISAFVHTAEVEDSA